jgi:hypothetical protein
MKDTLTDEGTITLESVPTISSTSSITPSVALYVSRTQPDDGWCWLGHDQLKRVEQFLEKKARPSVRSVLLAYAQLSSRNGNARNFPAAARLVATMAGVAVSTLHEADAKLASLGLIEIRQRKDERGLDAPRMVTLCDVLPELGAKTWELVTADELEQTATATRRRRSDSGVRLGSARLPQGGHTKETIKERPKENLSLNAPRTGNASPRERETWENVETRLAKENSVSVELIHQLREQHAAGLANLKSRAYQTPNNFTNALPSLIAATKGKAASKAPIDLVAKANTERTRWWKQAGMTGAWEDADDAQRRTFMTTNEGASFLALAEAWAVVCEETGQTSPRRPKVPYNAHGIRDRKDLLYDGTGEW